MKINFYLFLQSVDEQALHRGSEFPDQQTEAGILAQHVQLL